MATAHELRRERVAIHEAAHCVVALARGRRAGCALFDDDNGNVSGVAGNGELQRPDPSTRPAWPVSDDFEQTIFDAVELQAGHAAEAIYYQNGVLPENLSRSDQDRTDQLCTSAFSFAGQRTLNAFQFFARSAAADILQRHWPAVLKIANELNRASRLTPDECQKLFDDANN